MLSPLDIFFIKYSNQVMTELSSKREYFFNQITKTRFFQDVSHQILSPVPAEVEVQQLEYAYSVDRCPWLEFFDT